MPDTETILQKINDRPFPKILNMEPVQSLVYGAENLLLKILSSKDNNYIFQAMEVRALEVKRRELMAQGKIQELEVWFRRVFSARKYTSKKGRDLLRQTRIGSALYLSKSIGWPDREQINELKALGCYAIIMRETSILRDTSIQDVIPLTINREEVSIFVDGGFLFIPRIRHAIQNRSNQMESMLINHAYRKIINLKIGNKCFNIGIIP